PDAKSNFQIATHKKVNSALSAQISPILKSDKSHLFREKQDVPTIFNSAPSAPFKNKTISACYARNLQHSGLSKKPNSAFTRRSFSEGGTSSAGLLRFQKRLHSVIGPRTATHLPTGV